MRIAVLSNAHDATGGGTGRIAQVYSELLRNRGHEVKAWGPKPAFTQLSRMSGIKRLAFHLEDLSSSQETFDEILKWKPDVLLTHNLTGCGFGTAKQVQKQNIRWVHVLHDVQLIEPSGQIIEGESFHLYRQLWRTMWSRLRKTVFGFPSAIISPSQWLIHFHKNWNWFHGVPTSVIPNPIHFAERGSTEKNLTRAVFVGRLGADKGFDVLSEAWKKVDAQGKELACIGFTAPADHVSDKSMRFLGQLSSDQVSKEMAKSSLVIVPSRVWENQPTVILEAMASGCQVIASRVGGIPELLRDFGTLVPAGDASALAQAIQNAFDHPEMSEAQNQARLAELQRHDPEGCVTALEGVLRSNLNT